MASTMTQERLERIWATIRDIPVGYVASYGQIADIAGIPRGARQVGYALRLVPDGRDLPWHRVITASGKPAFDRNSSAYERQTRKLAEEGVPVLNGRIDMRTYRWQPELDELLWKPSAAWDQE